MLQEKNKVLKLQHNTIIPAIHSQGKVTFKVTLTRREADAIKNYGLDKTPDKYQVEGFKRGINKIQHGIGQKVYE